MPKAAAAASRSARFISRVRERHLTVCQMLKRPDSSMVALISAMMLERVAAFKFMAEGASDFAMDLTSLAEFRPVVEVHTFLTGHYCASTVWDG